MPSEAAPSQLGVETEAPPSPDLATLFHRLNNQLGTGLAYAELIELKSSAEADRSRSGEVVRAVLEAMITAHEIRARVATVLPIVE
jgi:hypothetical protein